jgi:isoleucyl-tRNA synthetase
VNWCAVDLSGFYLDALKTRLYTRSLERRRSAQTALFAIADALARYLAPVLPFTAEEVWEHLPGKGREASVHFCELPPEIATRTAPGGAAAWSALLELRPIAGRLLEALRAGGRIGASTDAALVLWVQDPALQGFVRELGQGAEEVFLVSSVELAGGPEPVLRAFPAGTAETAESPGGGAVLAVGPAPGAKCERCWLYRTTVGRSEVHPTLCHECVEVLEGEGEGWTRNG